METRKREEKEKKINPTESQVREHAIKVYSNFSCGIHTDVNKRQIMGGKNSPDKIEERRRGNIPQMIILRNWNTGSVIKSQCLKESGPYLPLMNCIFTFRYLEERLSRT